MSTNRQSLLFRGIFEFEDPSGTLLGARVPQHGSANLYRGTRVLVRPNQQAMFLYNGKLAGVLHGGNHELDTESLPILAQLAGFKFGFESPLRSEIWFFATNLFTARKWGTKQPILHKIEGVGFIPLRSYGNFTISITDPFLFFKKIVGSRTSYDITELDEFIQGLILESLPQAMQIVTDVQHLNTSQDEISKKLEDILKVQCMEYGLVIEQIQILSLIPSEEVLKAIDERTAMNIIGSKKEYLLYKAANSLDEISGGQHEGGNNSMQMMMGLMLGRGLLGAESDEQPAHALPLFKCPKCGTAANAAARFCSECGEGLKK